MDTEQPPRYAVVANHRTGTSPIARGALVYIKHIPGYPEHCLCAVRSRGGRWLEVWIALKKLQTFRIKAIYPGHRLHADLYFGEREYAENMLARINLVIGQENS